MSKKQLMSISETEKNRLLKKEVQRSADELIREFDCLYYLLAEARDLEDQLLRGRQLADSDTETIVGSARETFQLIQAASNQIEKKILEAHHETGKIVGRLLSKGDTSKAYLLATVAAGKISYQSKAIEDDYVSMGNYMVTAQRSSIQACLDTGIDLHFRVFKGLGLLSGKGDYAFEFPTHFTDKDISFLYTTLDAVAQKCSEGFEYDPKFGIDKPTYERLYSNGYLFRRLSPLFFTALLLNREYFPGTDIRVSDWPTVITNRSVRPKNLGDHNVEAKAHVAAAYYFLGKSYFLRAINIIHSHHCNYILSVESNTVNDAPIRLSIVLRLFDTFDYFMNLYHRYRVFHRPKPPGVASYPPTLPGFENVKISNTLPLTAFMVAILSFDLEDVLSVKFVDRFLNPEVSHLWTGPTQISLASVLNEGFAQDKDTRAICLRPVHLAGLAKQIDLFKILFENDKENNCEISTVAVVAVHNDDRTLFPLLSRFFKVNIETRNSNWFWLTTFIDEYGSNELAQSLRDFFNLQEWFTRQYWLVRPAGLRFAGIYYDASQHEPRNGLTRPPLQRERADYFIDESHQELTYTSSSSQIENTSSRQQVEITFDDPTSSLQINPNSYYDHSLPPSSGQMDESITLVAAENEVGIGPRIQTLVEDLPVPQNSGLDIVRRANTQINSISNSPLLFLAPMDLDSYETDSFTGRGGSDPKKRTKTRITAITITSKTSSSMSSAKSVLSLGGMSFLVPSSRQLILDTAMANLRKRKRVEDEEVLEEDEEGEEEN
ncbi:hypothetical protein TWF506_007575 [Arthrobotrys conoides]|uniref:Uncharacterized protein n=1 Tax=Arthrobotrys conoides TaxID=74498 RepID=A0AAN8RZP9_9PEZI